MDLQEKTIEIEIRGKTYTLTETKLSDFLALRSHIKSRRLREVNSLEELSLGERAVIISDVVKMEITDTEVEQEADTLEGMLFLIHRSLSKKHPELTLEDVHGLFSHMIGEEIANISRIQTSLSEVKDKRKNVKRAAAKK